jgi:DNA-binding transcriptional ArsR family regulator
MDFELTQTLLQSGISAQREAAARSLGRNLAANGSGEWLDKFRRLASKLLKTASTDYERGFLDAMELVATGFERQSSEDGVDEKDLVRIKSRAHWLATLKYLAKGSLRPSDLAERLNVHRSHVSRLLDELEESRLITRVQEGKERPCRLSPRARVMLGKLPDPEMLDAPSSAQIVGAVFRCIGVLVRDGRAGRTRLLTTLREDLKERAPNVLDLISQSFKQSGLGIVDDDDALIATEDELHSRISGHLSLGCADKPSALIDQLKTLAQGGPLLLRAGDRQQEWEVIVERHRLDLRVLREQDIQLSALPDSSEYGVVYESPSLVADDRRQAQRSSFIDSAQRRYCLRAEQTSYDGFQSIVVPAPELAAA